MKTLRPEWPTLAMIAACYAAWMFSTTVLATMWLPLAMVVAAFVTAFHASLTHEVVHGHPFPGRPGLNSLFVFPNLALFVPFGRFRDTHLAHHNDATLTDPYDDPETNYMDPQVWARLSPLARTTLNVNNTLLGRLILGPAIGLFVFFRGDWRAAREGDQAVIRAWIRHIGELIPVALWFVYVAEMPVWAYLIAAYAANSILRIRTFLEHQAHERSSGRTVIIEDRGPLALVFLNNNLHVVHHMHPKVAWYRLPALYRAHREHYLRRNGGYIYGSYGEVFARHFLHRKDPVPHPHRPG